MAIVGTSTALRLRCSPSMSATAPLMPALHTGWRPQLVLWTLDWQDMLPHGVCFVQKLLGMITL